MWRPLSFGVILSLVGCTFQLECAQITDCSTCVSDTVSTTVASTPFPVLGCAWCLKDGTCHAVGSTSNPCSSSDCISESTFSQCKKRSPGDCPSSSSWPSFSQKSDLKASPWGDYFQAVYGGLPTSYPYHVSDLWVLHDSVLISAHVTSIPDATSCPKKPLDRYNINDAYQPPQVSRLTLALPRPTSSPTARILRGLPSPMAPPRFAKAHTPRCPLFSYACLWWRHCGDGATHTPDRNLPPPLPFASAVRSPCANTSSPANVCTV